MYLTCLIWQFCIIIAYTVILKLTLMAEQYCFSCNMGMILYIN